MNPTFTCQWHLPLLRGLCPCILEAGEVVPPRRQAPRLLVSGRETTEHPEAGQSDA